MKIIIPMAGKALRLYPHTLNTPKPFLSIAGKTVLRRLLDNLYKFIKFFSVQEIIFIIKPIDNIKNKLISLSKEIGITPVIYYQKYPLGTADALLKADKSMIGGPIIIAFSDTLFNSISFIKIKNESFDNIIWTKKVKNPNLFGVVKCDSNKLITNFIEKPEHYQSNLAIIGLYYFKNSITLKNELWNNYNIKNKKEYQLTYVLEAMRKKGVRFISCQVKNWMDFGNKNSTLSSHSKILSMESKNYNLINKKSTIKNSLIINPCYIGKETIIENCIIGPYVSIEKYTIIKNSNIKKSIIQNNTKIMYANLHNSIIGKYSFYKGKEQEISISDYSILK
ncbi:sugar phosphate nucleotidyltransferase [Blattabacterium cuenoti]|uniref:sugar phosphate nucleotidyltransferase n=1 Tax=Blattabacterium cuenoti TaxID=1653831 RepID=UPI00163BA2A2|nr:sugar phosphate nucleotidyltransferase [Blattabacterium cuenoti]